MVIRRVKRHPNGTRIGIQKAAPGDASAMATACQDCEPPEPSNTAPAALPTTLTGIALAAVRQARFFPQCPPLSDFERDAIRLSVTSKV
jgi:hypothetical protein